MDINSLLYDSTKEEILAAISQMKDSDLLYIYAEHYNWDDGFEIPQAILKHNLCNLSIALLIFYRADGDTFLMNKSDNQDQTVWYSFVKNLYESIVEGAYQKTDIQFKPPLTKVQLYKLKKFLSDQELIFIETIEGKDLDNFLPIVE